MTGSIKSELNNIRKEEILSVAHRKKKLLAWFFRTVLASIIIYFIWDYSWINIVLWIYDPINLISFLSILLIPYFLKINGI